MRDLWNRLCCLFGSPVFIRRFNGWAAVFWVVMIPVSVLMGWLNVVAYVSVLSIWALVASHWATWQAARVEVRQVEQQNGQSSPETHQ